MSVSLKDVPENTLFKFVKSEKTKDAYESSITILANVDYYWYNSTPGCIANPYLVQLGFCTYRMPKETWAEFQVEIETDSIKQLNLKTKNFFQLRALTGWDPELFVVDEKNKIIPAFEFLPPKPMALNIKRYMYPQTLYSDGFASEWTCGVHDCHGWGIDTIREGIKRTFYAARAHNPKANVTLQNTFIISPIRMKRYNDEQIRLGCNPSKNAYGDEPIQILDARKVGFRSAGGHIHFSISEYWKKTATRDNWGALAQGMDLFLGLPCVALFSGIDNPLRRTLYGRAGEYRTPPYGIEYRVLSNAWLGMPEITHLVMNTARSATKLGRLTKEELNGLMAPEELKEIINVCDVPRARAFVEKHWNLFLNLSDLGSFNLSKKLWMDGVKHHFPNYDTQILENWLIPESPIQLDPWIAHSNDSKKTWGQLATKL